MFDESRINIPAFDYYRRLRRVRSFVQDNLEQPLRVEQAARVAGLSPGYFSTFFKQKTGVRFTTWITYLRIERAKRELLTRNDSITQIACSTGYGDLRTFERAFKRVTNQTPYSFKSDHRPS